VVIVMVLRKCHVKVSDSVSQFGKDAHPNRRELARQGVYSQHLALLTVRQGVYSHHMSFYWSNKG
jgi:hypothetical protein